MKRLVLYVFGLFLAMPWAWAESQQKPVILEEASTAAGLNAGSQQRLLKQGIDLQQLSLGITEAYRVKPTQKRLEIATKKISIIPSANEKNNTANNKKNLAQASFELGLVIAASTQEQLKILSVSAFMEGFKTGYTTAVTSPALASASIVVNNFFQQERMSGAAERLIKSKEFLAENAKRKGVIVTGSGLQYEILVQGTGAKPAAIDMVTVNYRHTKPNSNFMYDSAEHGHSETMALRGVIPEGWKELFLLMNKGSRYRVYLPPALGWGEEGNGDALLPNEVLITEFTLLDIIPPPPVDF